MNAAVVAEEREGADGVEDGVREVGTEGSEVGEERESAVERGGVAVQVERAG